jgi:hypothetical protein
MEYILISTAVAGIVLFVAFFLHSTREANEEYEETSAAKLETSDFWGDEGRSASVVVSNIFSSEDEQFISREANEQVNVLFRRERKRLALRWIERQKQEASGVMRRHRNASRRAADLLPANEVKLFLRYARLKVTFEFLAVSVWLVGPERLQGLAEETNAVFHGMQNVKTLGGEN